MKTTKKLVLFILILCMVLSILPCEVLAADMVDGSSALETISFPEGTIGCEGDDIPHITSYEPVEGIIDPGQPVAMYDVPYVASERTGETVRYSVLVLDTSDSSSFEENGWVFYTADTAIDYVKASAKKFVSDVQKAGGINYVAVVEYRGAVSNIVSGFTTDYDTLNQTIDGLYSSGGVRSVAYGLQKVNSLLDAIPDPDAIKNVVLFTTGMTNEGPYSYSGRYDENTIASDWRRMDTQVRLYAYSNSAIAEAEKLKSKATLYTVGLFQVMEDMPQTGREVVEFFKLFAKDMATSEDYFYDVKDPSQLEFAFGDIAGNITDDNSDCPIIIVPGVMGSRLYDADGDRIWEPSTGSAIWKAVNPFTSFGKEMGYGKTVYLKNNHVNQVTTSNREYGAQDTYKKLVDTLCSTYPEREVYFFSYDFREDNAKSAKELNNLIEWALDDEEWTKVDIVCHSMGGLVTSSYVAQYGSKRINHVITFGTPYEGAPKLVNAVLNWDVLTNRYEDNDWLGSFNMSTISDTVLGFGGLTKEVKAGFPAIAQLAPTKTMFNKYYYYQRTKTGALWWTKEYDNEISYSQYQTIMRNIFGSNFTAAENFHSSIKDSSGVNELAALRNSYFVVGTNQPTIGALIFNDGNSLSSLECVDLMYEYRGDGTVPYYSATMDTYIKSLNSNRYLEVSDTHTGIVSNTKALNWLTDILSSESSNESSDSEYTGKYVVIRIACPVEVEVLSGGEVVLSSDLEDANFTTSVGRIDLTGAEAEIKMLCLRADDFDIVMVGTDEGEMDFAIRFFDENGILYDERVYEGLPVTEDTIVYTSTEETETTVLSVDEDGDGEIDYTTEPLTETLEDPYDPSVPVSSSYTVTVTASPAAGGAVSGGGDYGKGASVTVKAVANSGYRFVRWTEGNTTASTNATYTFEAKANRTLTAVFEWIGNGGGGGGYTPSNSSYQITVPTTSNGTVTVTPTSAKSGAKVTITAMPDSGYTVGNVNVRDASGNTVAVTSLGNNQYSFTMPSRKITVEVTFVPIQGSWTNPFTDVAESDWFYDGVAYVAQNGLMQGVGGGKFNPSGTTSRGMIATILYRLEGEPAVSQSTFTDVAAGQYYTDAVAWAAAYKIVEGYGNNSFGPDDDITREQMAAVLYRYAVYKGYDVSGLADLSGYTDASSISSWGLTAMRWANSEDLIGGRTMTTLVPKGTATRAEAATILARFCRKVAGLE